MTKKKKIIFLIVFIIGITVMSYPFISNYIKQKNQTDIISQYEENINNLSNEDIEKLKQEAQDYNDRLAGNTTNVSSNKSYVDLLNIGDIIGYVIIPKIDVKLPIYHGTSEEVLQKGVGHLETSSLPIGGNSTHSVLTGHRGLPSSKLFTDLDKIEIGDVFFINILGEYISYRVDEINVVLPTDTSLLAIEKDKDLCTLITCTPYMINSHRLLVRGTRSNDIYTEEETYEKQNTVINENINIAETTGYPIIENTNQYIIIYFAAFCVFISVIYLIYYTFNVINLIKNSKENEEMLTDNNTPIIVDEENGIEEIEEQSSFAPISDKEAFDFVENKNISIIPNPHQYEKPIGPEPAPILNEAEINSDVTSIDEHEEITEKIPQTKPMDMEFPIIETIVPVPDIDETSFDENIKNTENNDENIIQETDDNLEEMNDMTSETSIPKLDVRVEEHEFMEKVPFDVVEVLKKNKKTIISAAIISSAIVGLYFIFQNRKKK